MLMFFMLDIVTVILNNHTIKQNWVFESNRIFDVDPLLMKVGVVPPSPFIGEINNVALIFQLKNSSARLSKLCSFVVVVLCFWGEGGGGEGLPFLDRTQEKVSFFPMSSLSYCNSSVRRRGLEFLSLTGKVEVKRDRGKQRITFLDSLCNSRKGGQSKGLNFLKLSDDRDVWRGMAANVCSRSGT